MKMNIWEGIYNNFDECPKSGEGFNSLTWLTKSLERLNKLLDLSKQKSIIPHSEIFSVRMSLLPILTAIMTSKNITENIKILDFGGGLGFTYVQIINSCLNIDLLDYHIVESKTICEAGRKIFKHDKKLQFHTTFPSHLQTVDIVYLGSSIQYIQDWKKTLLTLKDFNPNYFVFTDLTAGDVQTYATVQKYYESYIPCWFFNLENFINYMNILSYNLIFKANYIHKILGKEQGIPQNNFPKKYRIGNSCNLLFSRTNFDMGAQSKILITKSVEQE